MDISVIMYIIHTHSFNCDNIFTPAIIVVMFVVYIHLNTHYFFFGQSYNASRIAHQYY